MQPAVDPHPLGWGHLREELGEFFRTHPTQSPHINMPEGFGLADQTCPGARLLPLAQPALGVKVAMKKNGHESTLLGHGVKPEKQPSHFGVMKQKSSPVTPGADPESAQPEQLEKQAPGTHAR